MHGMRWIPTELDPHKMIAVRTLDEVRAALGAASPPAPQPSESDPVTVHVPDHPSLGHVGGVARVSDGQHRPVGIARISRSSFVAYELDGADLRELPVETDPSSETLHVLPARARAEAPERTEPPR